MSEYQIIAVVAAVAFLYSLIASRLERTPVSGALVYIICGLLCGPSVFGIFAPDIDGESLKMLAELTLAVVLFSDSANANLRVLRRVERLPIRLLLIGLPLTILLGFAAAYLMFDGMSLVAMALLATMLAPTDAALGKAVVTNENVPSSVREGLNVESGLNDGICVPVILIFMEMVSSESPSGANLGMFVQFPLQAIGIGAIVGVAVALLAGPALRICATRGWVAGSWIQVPVIAAAMLCFGTAQWLGGSGFIAAFVGGLIFGGLTHQHKEEVLNGAEGTGDTLSLITWFSFGAVVVGPQIASITWQPILYAILSLTVVRMLPVWLCVSGMGLKNDSKLFLGWFGPRGLASIVFIVMVAATKIPETETLMATVSWTIILSVVLHGITANPLAAAYGAKVGARDGVV